MSGAAPTLLEYASPAAAREPWGPLLFRPSRRSLVLLLLTAAAVTWLALRHDPWRHVASIPGDYQLTPLFTPDNQILAFDTRFGVNLCDPTTGHVIRTVLQQIDTGTYRYYVVAGSRQILALPWTERTARLYDVQTGRQVDRFSNPDGLGSQLIAVASDPLRIICYASGLPKLANPPPNTTQLRMWELARNAATRPILLPRHGIGASFSDDGQRILQELSGSGFILLDGAAHLIGWQDYPHIVGSSTFTFGLTCRFAGPNHFWVARNNASTGADVIEIRPASTGELLNTVSLPARTIDRATWILSDDAALLALFNPTTSGVTPGILTLDFHDTVDHRVIASRFCQAAWPAVFFPHSHHLLAPDADTPLLAVIDPAHAQPLALIPNSSSSSSTTVPEISPDGQTLVISTGSPETMLNIYRRAGPDCPESAFGALAFPQTWLTAAAFIALTLALCRGARRARRAASPPSRLILTLLIATTLPLSLHALLAACLGHCTITSAPLFLLASIGLVTGARVWRYAALLLLAANLPLCLYLARRVQQANLRASTGYQLLDRFHEIPNILPFIGLLAASALIVIALPRLARPKATLIA
jgi:WD40 repeat protein